MILMPAAATASMLAIQASIERVAPPPSRLTSSGTGIDSTTDPLTIPQFRDRLQQYRGIDSAVLRRHLSEFLAQVTPVAESLGVTLTLHPDDPPRPLFGLPRIASSAEDYQTLFDAVPSKANGICFCTGSLGVRAENDLPVMAKRFAPRIGFAHLRATKREGDGLSFFESDHLDGDVDMIAVLKALLADCLLYTSPSPRD